jgi:ATP-dependent Clp protease ATP-binding subunit ClpX
MEKFINTWDISDFEILTDNGFVEIEALHKTIKYDVIEIWTNNGYRLCCADNHIVFKNGYKETFVKDICEGDMIITDKGLSEVIVKHYHDSDENMYDFQLSENSNHRYYTNGILSHNTYIARTIAKLLDVPFCIVDSTVLTESGYVGEDVESILTRLLQVADYDVEKAEHGIVFIDEIDKIARKGDNPSITRDVSGEGVQQGLLKLLEGSVVLVPPNGGRKHPDQKMIPVNTKDILFICGGAFDGIEKKIEGRLNIHALGFNNENRDNPDYNQDNPLENISPLDLKAFGMIPEIIGRLPVITYMDHLDKKALKRILVEPKNSLVKQYQKLMMLDGINLTFDEKVYDYIVERTIENKIGARGLRGIMEDLMTKIMFDSPSGDKKDIKVTLAYAKKILDKKYLKKK